MSSFCPLFYFIVMHDDDDEEEKQFDELDRETSATFDSGSLLSVGCLSSGQPWEHSFGSSRASSLACQSAKDWKTRRARLAWIPRAYLQSRWLRCLLLLSFDLFGLFSRTSRRASVVSSGGKARHSLDGVLSLGLAKFGLLVALGENFRPCDTGDGTLELHVATRALFRLLFGGTFLVLAAVENGPCHTTWIASHISRTLTFRVQVNVNLGERHVRVAFDAEPGRCSPCHRF